MKYKTLSPQHLGLLTVGLSRSTFPKPNIGELLVEDGLDDSCTLYFEDSYYNHLYSAIENAYFNGDFARSNSESEWNDFMRTIGSAKSIEAKDINKESLRPHFLSIRK